ncbi:MAG: hypothetical protein L3J29_07405 [Cyclobacteriaceae bacterium]|nr:hypothetical protein [Cyclobacteriaceae bacterium]
MNKQILYCCLILLASSYISSAQQLSLNGVYRGRDVYVQNPYNSGKNSFCVQSISLNGNTIISSPNSSALTIDLSPFQLNDSISLLIFHYSECLPKILNPRVLQAGSGFSIVQPMADNSSISWISTGEQDKNALYQLEKLFLEGWKTIEQIKAKGDIDNNQYSIGAVHYAGQNQFRIHYVSESIDVYSEVFEYYSTADPISFYPTEDIDELISLSKPTDYQIKDAEGKLYKKGFGLDIFIRELKPGEYILIIENREELFYKPEPEIEPPPVRKRKKH